MKKKLWKFIDNFGSFESSAADKIKTLYFPLANEKIMSSVSPDLHGDIKSGQDSFLLEPVSRIGLGVSRSSRNFWVYLSSGRSWSATGVSKNLREYRADRFNLKAGLLWQRVERENKGLGLKAEITSFVPARGDGVEVMQVKITNFSGKRIRFTPTAAIPIYGRGANNLRDHRHVTSLLQRASLHKFGVLVKPVLSFDETGHRKNELIYFVLGWGENSQPPCYIYPTQEMFCGESGDLEAPLSVLDNLPPPEKLNIQGKETMGALRFSQACLRPKESRSYTLVMGIAEDRREIAAVINKLKNQKKLNASLKATKDHWQAVSRKINVSTRDYDFDNWFLWVAAQPELRKIYGCSFLPDFDYGKGGRGWRDLWQDLLGLILNGQKQARQILINNFSGVRIDGSNATIIGRRQGEFISDRNNLSRVWMDHGAWPLITLDLYLNETGDFGILFEQVPYFRNHEICRARSIDYNWKVSCGQKLKTSSGRVYRGSILEHLLLENLVQFFNVGAHNHIRLEGADWNDGLDMARDNGESVAFSALYAQNLLRLSGLLLKTGNRKIKVAGELKILLAKINYNDTKAKLRLLDKYFSETKFFVSGRKVDIDPLELSEDLKLKSQWMTAHIRKSEWLKEGFYNGYYDNRRLRVEGRRRNSLRMILSSQVLPIMSDVAQDWQVAAMLKNIKKNLFDRKLNGFHLNTDFKEEQLDLGRAFSFSYGDKENGAVFNHMVVMLAFALYRRGYVKEGWSALKSIYKMALDTEKSKIYPCLPEYFNLEGRGMYSYLTGSASWYVLTMATEVFGVKGRGGDLFIEPKLSLEQFENSSVISIDRVFAGRRLQVSFYNPGKLDYGRYRIVKASLNHSLFPLTGYNRIIISRKDILRLSPGKLNNISIFLG